MPSFPFEWWLVVIVTLLGTVSWLLAVYYATVIGAPREERRA